MNERIKELIKQCTSWSEGSTWTSREVFDKEKFAELIVRECIKTIEYRAPGQMGKEGEGWTNGYDDGLKTGAWLLKEHFGVEE
jgi:hypothetical protein